MDQSLSCAQSAADPRKLANLGRGHVCSSLHPIYRREPECAALLFLWLRRLGRKQHSACLGPDDRGLSDRSEEHTSELQSLMRNSYAVFCLKKKTQKLHAIR